MGDSEDEFDRRRDKFQRERSDQYDRRAREREWSRERPRGWNGSQGTPTAEVKQGMRPLPAGENLHRRRLPEYPPPHELKRRYSPGREAEMRPRKKMRPYEPAFEHWGSPPWEHAAPRPPFHPRDDPWGPGERGPGHPVDADRSGPRLMTFKQWLNMQSDDITDEDAIEKYTQYKVDFRRQQLQEFFVAHKDEEWFKEKYHPDDSAKRFIDEQASVKWRANVFKRLMELGTFAEVDLDLANENEIIKVLDSAEILMEGGTSEDLKILDMDPKELEMEALMKAEEEAKKKENEAKPSEENAAALQKQPLLSEEQYELKKQAELYKKLVDQQSQESSAPPEAGSKGKKKRDRGYMGYDDDADDSSSDSSSSDLEGDERKNKEPKVVIVDTQAGAAKGKEEGELTGPPQPRALHQTHSLFMKHLPPSVTKLEIVNLCKKYPGFIRVAFSHPLEDKNRFFRRCWVTFDRSVNIKDICWNLNNLRLRDIELNPVVNRDLSRRVRPISGIAQHSSCARNDLKNVVRLIMHLDQKWKLWMNGEASGDGDKKAEPENPWLKNISEYLVDESSAEEEELVGEKDEKEEGEEPVNFVKITRDSKLIKVVDRLLYYLRIVYSVDYYNASEYPCEDEMPNRCGIVHARGPIPPNMLTKTDINEFQKRFNDKLVHILNFKDRLTEEEAKKLGPKNVDEEVERFVTSNTQELGKDKWLCPLSGKKFKGPDYIRKHIFNKHGDKVEAVKKEVAFFNNYLMDPRRPGPLDGIALKQAAAAPTPPHPPAPAFHAPPMHMRPFAPPMPGTPMYKGDPGRVQFSTPQFHQRPPVPYGNGAGRTYPPKAREARPAVDPYSSRPIVGYQDLDAPDDTDFF